MKPALRAFAQAAWCNCISMSSWLSVVRENRGSREQVFQLLNPDLYNKEDVRGSSVYGGVPCARSVCILMFFVPTPCLIDS